MASFVDTTLLECNRLQSIEGLVNNDSNNNAEWTNRMGEVIQLVPGDRVSVSSAYINTRGCGGQNIEIKGKDFNGLSKTFNYTKLISQTSFDPIAPSFRLNNIAYENPEPAELSRVGMIKSQTIENVTEDILLKDDQMNVEMGFYKSTNGEGYMHLPRRFYGQDEPETSFEKINTSGTASVIWTTYDDYLNGNTALGGPQLWNTATESVSVALSKPPVATQEVFQYPITNLDNQELKCLDEWFIFDETKPVNVPDGYYIYYDVGGTARLTTYLAFKPIYSYWRQQNDNSRYTLLKTPIYHSVYADDGKTWFDNFLETRIKYTNGKYDPALLDFINYKELITIKVDKGFNSPQSVAEQITQQLQQNLPDNPKTFSVYDTGASFTSAELNASKGVDLRASIQEITETYSTNTWKPIMCGNIKDNSKATYEATYNKGTSASATQQQLDHYNSFRNIYVRRPNLFEIGRKLNNPWAVLSENASTDPTLNGMFNKQLLDIATPNQTFQIEGMEYTDANLKLLSNLFIQQGLHPELFKNNSTLFPDETVVNINNSRFLHFSRWEHNASHYTDFGDDNYEPWNYWNGDKALLPLYPTFWQPKDPIRQDPTNLSHGTVPLFFKYDLAYEGKFIVNPTIDQLSYGFATKYEYVDGFGDTKYGVEIHPELVGGLKPYIYKYGTGQSASDTPSETEPASQVYGYQPGSIQAGKHRIGWDWHFSAYGNATIQGFSGYNFMSPDGQWCPGIKNKIDQAPNYYSASAQVADNANTFISKHLTSTYIGAKNCACTYDTTTNKFGFQYLHTAENIGNTYNAGSTNQDASGTSNTNPITTDADEEVYKINKRPKLNTYCPNMKPYQLTKPLTLGNVSGTTLQSLWEYSNQNIKAWQLFDSHCGVFMDFKGAYPEDIFKDGLLGIMGFTYDQFDSKVADRQARVGYDNISNLGEYITTNSQIVSTDTTNFMVNPYGAVMYSTQIPASYLVNTMSTSKTLGKPVEYLPVISEQTQSITIEGTELPRTMLRPYYCIRSDIIGQSNYVGGTQSGLRYPIISVINKINSDKDFVQLSGGDLTMTITKQVRLTDITTTITDPNGTLANLDDGSCVIYRIEKDDNTERFDIVDQILNKNKKK
mgnify:FL=1